MDIYIKDNRKGLMTLYCLWDEARALLYLEGHACMI